MLTLENYTDALDILASKDKRMRRHKILKAGTLKSGKKKKIQTILDLAVSRGDVEEKIRESKVGYVISERGAIFLEVVKGYQEFSRNLGLKNKNGLGIRLSESIIETLRTSPGLNLNRIYGKIYRVSSVNGNTKTCLNFLEENGYISSRELPEKGFDRRGTPKKIYFPEEKGIQFIAGYHGFDADFDLSSLEQKLSIN